VSAGATAARIGERLLNRELSWLDFNARVLELAEDQDVPLLERVKFCAIFSANLDEFFMVRVAGLQGQAASGLSVRSPDGRSPAETLAEIRGRVTELTARQAKLWRGDLRPALDEQEITVARIEDLRQRELDGLTERFERQIYPVLTPLAVGPGQPVFDALLADNAQGWELGGDGTWERQRPKKDERARPAHAALMRSTRARFRRRAAPTRGDR
jgi:polyphosphate kinase